MNEHSGQPGPAGEPQQPWYGPQGYPPPQPYAGYGQPPSSQPPSWSQPPGYPPAPGYGYSPWQPAPAHAVPPLPRRRGHPLAMVAAWLVIVAITTALVLMHSLLSGTAPPASTQPNPDSVEMLMTRVQAQYMVGAAAVAPGQELVLLNQAEMALNVGTLEQRLSFVALARELGGAEVAAEKLQQLYDLLLELQPELSAEQQELLRIMAKINGTPGDDVELTAQEKSTLEAHLGWVGKLAITHAEPDLTTLRSEVMGKARAVAFSLIGVAILIGMLGFAGFIALMVMFVLVAIGRVQMRFRRAIPDAGIYAETFAVWMILFVGLQVVVGLAMGSEPNLAASLVLFFVSLVALAWPVFRGIPFGDMRREIGWTTGRGVFVEIGAGLASYAMTLPLLAVGLGMTLVLMGISGALSGEAAEPFDPQGYPAHPIVELVSGPGWTQRVLLILVASVAAPIVEETMFRGVLYRTLRNVGGYWPRALSVIVSIGFVSLIFAAVHPQGLVAIPALGALAAGMALAREWRDSLIAPMVLHATSNGIVMTLLMVIAAS